MSVDRSERLFHFTFTAPPIAPGPEGFVHLSSARQLERTANRFFHGRRGLSLLELDTVGLDVRWEWNDGDLFPHLYGPLPASAVVRIHPCDPESDGTFRFSL